MQEMTPILRNELVFDRHSTLSQRSALESLKREAIELELQIRQLQVCNKFMCKHNTTQPASYNNLYHIIYTIHLLCNCLTGLH